MTTTTTEADLEKRVAAAEQAMEELRGLVDRVERVIDELERKGKLGSAGPSFAQREGVTR